VKLNIRIYNLSGQLQRSNDKAERICVAGLPPGIYILADEFGRAGNLVINP